MYIYILGTLSHTIDCLMMPQEDVGHYSDMRILA